MTTISALYTGTYTSTVVSDITSGTSSLYAVPFLPGRAPAERVPALLGTFTPTDQDLELSEALLTRDTWYDLFAVDSDGSVSNVVRHSLRPQQAHFGVDLVITRTEEDVPGRTIAYRVTIEATDARNFGNELFLFERQPYCADGTLSRDVLVAVCKPGDLEYYPTQEPSDTAKPYFRKSSVDLIFKSVSLLEETLNYIDQDVKLLLDGLEILRTTSPTEIKTFDGVATE